MDAFDLAEAGEEGAEVVDGDGGVGAASEGQEPAGVEAAEGEGEEASADEEVAVVAGGLVAAGGDVGDPEGDEAKEDGVQEGEEKGVFVGGVGGEKVDEDQQGGDEGNRKEAEGAPEALGRRAGVRRVVLEDVHGWPQRSEELIKSRWIARLR